MLKNKNFIKMLLLLILSVITLSVMVCAVAPVMNSSRISPTIVYTDDDLIGYCNATDGDGDNLTYYYTWYNGSEVYKSSQRPLTTGYCYQESAIVENQTGIDGNCNLKYTGNTITNISYYAYINYTKPEGATNNSLIRSKVGNSGTEVNSTIPKSCWNASSTTLMIRGYSKTNTYVSQVQCFNNTDWIILNSDTLTASFSETGTILSSANFIDGNWNTLARCGSGNGLWSTFLQGGSDDNANLYEEGVYWDIENFNQGVEVEIDTISSSLTNKNENWTLQCIANDGTTNSSILNSTTLTISNSVPSTPTNIIISPFVTSLFNNLTCFWDTPTDLDGDLIYNNTIWYKNNVKITPFNNLTEISYLNTTLNDEFICSVQHYDLTNFTSYINSSSVTITDVTRPNTTEIQPTTIYSNTTLQAYCNATYDVNNITSGNVGYYYRWYKNGILYNESYVDEYIYQENGTSYLLKPNYYYVNYTKLSLLLNFDWLTKYAQYDETNLTIPLSCLNYDSDIVQFRFYSNTVSTSSASSYPQCYNGSWNTIGSVGSGGGSIGGIGGTGTPPRLYDGDFDTYSAYYLGWQDPLALPVGSRIYEDAVYQQVLKQYNNSIYSNIVNLSLTRITTRDDNWTFSCLSAVNETNSTIWLNSSTITVTNTPPSVDFVDIVFNGSVYLNSNTTTDIDNDTITDWSIKWYLDGVYNNTFDNFTIITSGFIIGNSSWIASLQAYDGVNWSDYTNSTPLLTNDSISPTLTLPNVNPTTGLLGSVYTVNVTVNETNSIKYIYVEQTTPSGVKTNYTMSLVSGTSNNGIYSKTLEATLLNTYSQKIFVSDGSNNKANLTVDDYVVTSSTTTVVTGGGGGGATSSKKFCDIEFEPGEINIIGRSTETIVIKNNDDVSFTPNPVIPDELKDSILFTIPTSIIFTGQEGQLNFVNTNTDLSGEGVIVITSDNCEDIRLDITVKPPTVVNVTVGFFDKKLFELFGISITNMVVFGLSLLFGVVLIVPRKNIEQGQKFIGLLSVIAIIMLIFNLIF